MSFLFKPGPTFWPEKSLNMEFIKQNFTFQSLIKTEAILLPSMWLKDWLTKVKTSKIVTFYYFWTKMGKNFILISFKYSVSSQLSLPFSLRYFHQHYLVLANVYLMQDIKKTPLKYQFFFVFPQHCTKFGPVFAPQTTPTLLFLADF